LHKPVRYQLHCTHQPNGVNLSEFNTLSPKQTRVESLLVAQSVGKLAQSELAQSLHNE
jgi:hypothetical protein